MKTLGKFIAALLAIGLLGGGGYFAYLYLQGADEKNVYSLVPEDFVMLIESDQPIKDWRSLSESKVWKIVKQSEYFADITKSANALDSLLAKNRQLADMATLGKLLISTHVVSKSDYDFLILLDLNDKGKLANFNGVLKPILSQSGYSVSTTNVYNYLVFKLYDKNDNSTLYLSLVGNVLVASYAEGLLKKGIEHSEKSNVLDNPDFKAVHEVAFTDGIYNLMINYTQMDAFLRVFSAAPSDMILGLHEVVSFTGLNMKTINDDFEMEGYSLQKDSAVTYLNAFKGGGTGKIQAETVLPQSTVMYTSMGFSDFNSLFKEMQKVYSKGKEAEFEDMMKTKKQMESLLKIKIEDDLFSWMTEESVAAVVAIKQPDGTMKYANYALLHFDTGNEATVNERLGHLMRQIKRRTPLKFETETYNGHEIKYLEMKGFFSVFFKKLFKKIEKPHLTILGEYVVFSNDIPAMQYMIDAYEAGNVLQKDQTFMGFKDNFESESNMFAYLRNAYFYDYVRTSLTGETRTALDKNEIAFKSFPHIGFQLFPGGGMMKNIVYANVKEWVPEPVATTPIPANDSLSQDSLIEQ